MRVIDNLSRIEARITARCPTANQEGWDDVTVLLQRVEKVDARAELLNHRVGHEVVISGPADLWGVAGPGDEVHGHVSVAGPGRVLAAPQAAGAQGEFTIVHSDVGPNRPSRPAK